MRLHPRLLVPAIAAAATFIAGCGPSQDAKSARTPLAEKWYARAKQSFQSGDFEDARDAGQSALQAAGSDPEIRLLNARIALSRLEWAQAIKLTEGTTTPEGHGVRGRAYWYNGDIEQAADELEAMLQDPNVKDPWAREVAKLARRGAGRHPFAMEGSLVAAVEMPSGVPALIVPCEIEGEQALAMVATATGEVVLDSNSRKEPAWVNLRFGGIEVKDVPALTQDLSSVSRQLGAPIKALLGVNLLRHMHVTFDRRGDQFVVRREEPPAPPESTRVPLWYVRGGGMLLRATVTAKKDDPLVLLVDTSAMFPLALEDSSWKKAGVDIAKLQPEPSLPNMKSGLVPMVTIGGFDLPRVPAVQGAQAFDMKSSIDVDLGGIAGAGLLSLFRVTFGDEGRFVWLEADPMLTQRLAGRAPEPEPAPASMELTPPTGTPAAKPPMKPDAAPAKPAAAPAKPAPKPAAPKAVDPASLRPEAGRPEAGKPEAAKPDAGAKK